MRDSFYEGEAAAKAGKPLWENPYTEPTSVKDDFHHWFVGWCAGMKAKEEADEWAR